MFLFFVFFFSSRRRHTRFDCDWSSDVCSSDLNPEKVATPATAATVLVPDKVPLLGFVPIATVMFPVNPVAVLPFPSWAVIWTAGVIAAPATVLVGWSEETTAEPQSDATFECGLVLQQAPVPA